ncbi:hypothetical protein ACJMK2_035508 [Sinanodonta woodiana]|uniref:Uncharacterized protein n=1 Tax=Sinanodonta woodiana TaxID=1069815 RepID=A0ABD3WV59_SINWO
MAPTLYHQCQGMIHLLNRYNWTEFTIVTTKISSNKDFVGCMEEMVKLRGVTHGYITKYRFTLSSVIEIDAVSEAKIDKALAVVKQNTVRVFLLHAQSDEAKNILDRAERMGLTSEIYMWILTSSSIGVIPIRASSSYPIGSLGFSNNRSAAVIEQAVRSAIKVWALGLEEISKNQDILARTNLVPNMTCNASFLNGFWKDGKVLYTYMKKSKFDDPPVSFSDNGIINHATLDIYNVQPLYDKSRMFRKWEPVGKLLPVKNSTGHFEMAIQMNEITWPGRSTFPPKGKPDRRLFRIATLSEPPYVIYINPDETTGKCGHHAIPCQVNATRFENLNASFNGDVCCTGLCIDLLTMLSQTMDFDFVMYEINDTKWGIKDETTGEWNGLIRELVDHKSDFVMTSLKINHQRSSAIDFSVPFMETGITIIVSIRKGAISPTAFLEPYDYPSWCLILVFSVHATGASIFIFEWLSPSGLDHGKTPLREHKFSLFRSFWLIWAMLFGASVSVDNPRGVSSRFLANVWALFALVFLASYTANLAAFMITIDDYYKLSGIQDWRLMNPTAVTPHFRFATVPGGSTEDNLKKNYPRMHKYMMKYNKSTVQEGISALKRQEIHAFIYDSTVLEYWAGRDPECDLKTVGKWYAMTGYGIGFPRGSKYIDEFNKVLLEFQNNGK